MPSAPSPSLTAAIGLASTQDKAILISKCITRLVGDMLPLHVAMLKAWGGTSDGSTILTEVASSVLNLMKDKGPSSTTTFTLVSITVKMCLSEKGKVVECATGTALTSVEGVADRILCLWFCQSTTFPTSDQLLGVYNRGLSDAIEWSYQSYCDKHSDEAMQFWPLFSNVGYKSSTVLPVGPNRRALVLGNGPIDFEVID